MGGGLWGTLFLETRACLRSIDSSTSFVQCSRQFSMCKPKIVARWIPHPVMVTISNKGDYIRVLSCFLSCFLLCHYSRVVRPPKMAQSISLNPPCAGVLMDLSRAVDPCNNLFGNSLLRNCLLFYLVWYHPE